MLYDNLPGIELELKDGNLILPAEPAPTQTVLIIAPTTSTGVSGAYTAEEYNPVSITGQSDFAAKSMGSYDSNNPLARLWKQAYDAGCRDIKAIKLKGTTAAEKYASLHDVFYVLEESINADIVLVGGIYADDAVSGAVTFAFNREDYGSQIVADTGKGTAVTGESVTVTTLKGTLANKPVVRGTVVVKDGSDTIDETLYTVDLKTGEITFDDSVEAATVTVDYKHYAYDYAACVAGFCEIVSAKNKQVIGVMALKGPVDSNLSTVKTYVEGQKTQYYSKHLQIVGGAPLWFNIGNSMYEDMWHGAYAGFVSVLPSYSSPTFKAIPGALFASYNLSPTQITALINKHIVVPRARNGKIIVAEAITTSADTSDFVRLTTLRVINDAIQLVRDIAEPYIGEPNTVPRRNALDTAIREGLQKMVVRGALNDFRFHITATVADQIEGTMRIMLDLVPVFETRRILMAVAVKPML